MREALRNVFSSSSLLWVTQSCDTDHNLQAEIDRRGFNFFSHLVLDREALIACHIPGGSRGCQGSYPEWKI